MCHSTPAVIFLMGATASGKTTLSIELAASLGAEIISVDSALVYRLMNIGTAKPSMEERGGIVHHLIDVCDPWDTYSAARFCEDAQRLIEQIHDRGNRVLMVGGTMLYFKALEDGLAPLPEANETVRAAISAQAADNGWQALHDELSRVDPEAALRIHPNDPQRLQRALEVYRLSGRPMTQLLRETQSFLAGPATKFALLPANRQWLHSRIELRFKQMIEHGFLQEMEQLYAHPKLHAALPSMRSIGYRQAWQYLSMKDEAPDLQISLDSWIEKSVIATRQLAKRQLTWARGMHDINGIQCDTLSTSQQLAFINKHIQ